jgi:hypothetical protein
MIAGCVPLISAWNHVGRLAGNSPTWPDVSWRTGRGHFVVILRGALAAAIAPALREYLLRRVRESACHLNIDISTTGLDRQLHVHHSLEAAINGIASTR